MQTHASPTSKPASTPLATGSASSPSPRTTIKGRGQSYRLFRDKAHRDGNRSRPRCLPGTPELVHQLVDIMHARRMGEIEVCARAGLNRQTMRYWRGAYVEKGVRMSTPSLIAFEAAAQALGYRLVLEPIPTE